MTTPSDLLRRAAILVATLDTASADRLLEQMSAEDAAEVRRVMMELSDVDAAEELAVISQFMGGDAAPQIAEEAADVELVLSEAADALDVLRYEPLPDVAAIRQTNSPNTRPFLEDAPSERLAQLLAVERPQTIALVISRLSEARALEVLASLPDALRCEVLSRWISLDVADPELIGEIEQELRGRFKQQFGTVSRNASGLAQVTSIVQVAAPEMRKKLLASLARYDATAAQALSVPRLAFEDLEYLDDDGLAALLDAAQPQTLVLALAGATESFAERIARQLPANQARELNRSINTLGLTWLADIERAQSELARIAERLLHDGQAVASPLPLSVAN
ncbi:MAG TPA: FliG C-terminal domain-containing protein [Pirellulales bacterium]|jgi:flagellar motor switch protein FliG